MSGNKDNVAVADYREMVKTLVCGVKTITWGAGSCKVSTGGNDIALSTKALILPYQS